MEDTMGLWFLKCRILLSYLHAMYFLNFKSKDFISFPIKIKYIYILMRIIKLREFVVVLSFEILPHKEFRPIVKERRNNC